MEAEHAEQFEAGMAQVEAVVNKHVQVSNAEIRRRLMPVVSVKTASMGVVNELIEVGSDFVSVRSERTGSIRTVTYGQLRDAANQTRNGVIVRTLAQVVGLYVP